MVGDLAGRQHPAVDRDLVDGAREELRGRPGPDAVPADAPVSGVVLGDRVGVGRLQLAVDVELHAGRALGGHHVVPRAVVVGLRGLDEDLLAGVGAEAQPAVVDHVDVPVVGRRAAGLAVAEADDLAAGGGRGAEPRLGAVDGRVGERRRRARRAVRTVEGRRRVTGQADRRGSAPGHAHGGGGAPVGVAGRVVDGAARGLGQAPEQVRVAVDDGRPVGVARWRVRQGAPRREVVVADLLGGQRCRIQRDVVDQAGEVVARGPVRPAGEVVPADPPHARVGARRGDVGAVADSLAVDVERGPPGPVERGDHVVPLVVVVGGLAGDHLVAARGDAEVEATVVGQVDLAVARRAGVAVGVAEAQQLATRGGGGAEPQLLAEDRGGGLVVPVGRADDPRVAGPVEVERRVTVAGQRAGLAQRDPAEVLLRAVADLVVDARRAVGLAQTPVAHRVAGPHRLGVGAADLTGRRRDGDVVGHALVAERVDRADPVAVGRARHDGGVDEGHPGPDPLHGVLGRGEDRGGVVAVAVDLVGQPLVVAVPVGPPGHPDLPGGGRGDDRVEPAGPELGTHLVRCDGLDGEAHQPLLGGAVDRWELAREGDVAAVARDVPGTLALAGEAAHRDVRQPGEQRRGRLTGEVVVTALPVGDEGAGGRLGQSGAAVGGPRVGLPHASGQVAAVVGVAGDVDGLTLREGGVAVAVAVGDPLDLLGGPVDPRGSLEVAAGPEDEAVDVEAVVVADQVGHGRVRPGVADQVVGRPRQQRSGVGGHGTETVARVGRAVEAGEGASDDDGGLVRRDDHRVHAAALGVGRPGEQGAVARGDRGQAVAGGEGAAEVDAGEQAAEIDGGPGHRDRAHGGVGLGREVPGQRAGLGVDRGDAVADLAVDRRERPAEVDPGLVRRGREREHLAVGAGRPRVEQGTGADVIGEQVGAGHLVDSGSRPGRTGRGEVAADVDGVADDQLGPGHAVDLRGRQGVSRDRDRGRWIAGVDGRSVGVRGRPEGRRDDEHGGCRSSCDCPHQGSERHVLTFWCRRPDSAPAGRVG